MKCIVTGKETSNKWKNFPICKEFVLLAKQMEGENGFLDTTLRERLQILKQRWDDRVLEESQNKRSKK